MRGKSAIEERITDLAAAQHGIVTRRQLLAAGLGAKAIEYRAAHRRLIRVEPGVYALGHAELRREGRLLAIVLSCGPDAVLSHRSAASLLGLRPFGGSFVEVTIRSHRGRRPRPGLRVHRSTPLRSWEVTHENGIPTTTVARTLLDLAAVVPPHHLRRALERAEQLQLFDLRAIQRVIDANPRHPGRRPLIALLDDARDHGLTRTRSDTEALLLQVCIEYEIPRPQVNRYDGAREVDFRWPDHRLIVEVDGWAHHRGRDAFERDRVRDRELLRQGWRVARFTAGELVHAPAQVAEEIRRLLTVAA